ncbi:FMN-binding protein [Leyella stercorea]|uniref:FMN-binding protein n=1 Tax=Leyella stercorea TaxID=363265 RepID=UPI001F3DF547|nr:FMN-binding protein [Leyella stercorea]MCF2614029.1 4Fe-4S binding protein [Leyella stercorea]
MVKRQRKGFVARLLSLVVVVLILAAAAILRDGRILGHDLREAHEAKALKNDTLEVTPDGAFVVSTKPLAKDVQGYGGPVPLKIHIKDGRVAAVEAEPNAESPDFFNRAKELFNHWQNKSVDEALAEEVDAVSGATFSSRAIIANMQRGLAYAQKCGQWGEDGSVGALETGASPIVGGEDGSVGALETGASPIVALVVVLLGAVVPLFYNNRRLHLVQLAVNVVVLGLWTGTFVSYTLFMRIFAGGVSLSAIGAFAAPLLMLIVALIYPLAGRSGHYCANICPFGSAQELAGKLSRRKLRITPRVLKLLSVLRNLLWGVLMALLLTGTCTAWIDYELFTAFLYSSASVWVTVLAALFLVLSVWVPRPYCRFVCPTGALIKSVE